MEKLSSEFECKRITLVGDRGMIKSAQIEDLSDKGFCYISAISKPEIEKLLKQNIFQIELFDENLHEVQYNNTRYILRKKPYRAIEIKNSRLKKKAYIEEYITKKNQYLKDHAKADPKKALECIQEKIERLNTDYLSVEIQDRPLILKQDQTTLERLELLDGCYCLKTNVLDTDKQIIHDRYKDLTYVEEAFRTCKTNLLELRPWFVRTKESTKAHAFIVALHTLGVLLKESLEQA
ncbi:MAG: IS1634 family transposase [Minisyncoccia bacterium]